MSRQTIERLREAADEAFGDTPVLFAYVFGSVARGNATATSDVDVAVYLDPAASADPLNLSLELARRLAPAARPHNVEVVVLNDTPLPLTGRAVKERTVIYSRDEPSRVAFESLTVREFLDFEIHARPLDERFLRDIATGRR